MTTFQSRFFKLVTHWLRLHELEYPGFDVGYDVYIHIDSIIHLPVYVIKTSIADYCILFALARDAQLVNEY